MGTQVNFVTVQLYTTTNAITKISILLFYRRLTKGTLSTTYRYMLSAAIVSVSLYWLAFTIALLAGCAPFSAFWNQINPLWQTKYRCVDEPKVIIAASIVSVSQDFMCCFLPVILFWKLQISRKKKLALMGLFAVGTW
jgi:hypothetical protein